MHCFALAEPRLSVMHPPVINNQGTARLAAGKQHGIRLIRKRWGLRRLHHNPMHGGHAIAGCGSFSSLALAIDAIQDVERQT
ncbi:MAG: hypothetical protein ACFCVD_13485 [Nodosilinea sp.]